MVTKVIYARLYNLGNYENERLEVEVTVEDSGAEAVAGAWEDAKQAVEEQHDRLQTERDEAAQRRREEYEERERARTAEILRQREERLTATKPVQATDEPPF